MSRYAINAIRANPDATFNEFYRLLRQALPIQEYPQTPQLEGSEQNKSRVLFEPLPVEEPEPEPELEPPGCIMGWFQQLVLQRKVPKKPRKNGSECAAAIQPCAVILGRLIK